MSNVPETAASGPDRVTRHAGVDRLFHWLTALTVLVLMSTALLPIIGIRFDWVPIHWVAGIVLLVLVIFHILRSMVWRKLRSIWFSVAELRSRQVGKYSVAQKLMHHAMGLMVLGAVVTGVLQDEPILAFWNRETGTVHPRVLRVELLELTAQLVDVDAHGGVLRDVEVRAAPENLHGDDGFLGHLAGTRAFHQVIEQAPQLIGAAQHFAGADALRVHVDLIWLGHGSKAGLGRVPERDVNTRC